MNGNVQMLIGKGQYWNYFPKQGFRFFRSTFCKHPVYGSINEMHSSRHKGMYAPLKPFHHLGNRPAPTNVQFSMCEF